MVLKKPSAFRQHATKKAAKVIFSTLKEIGQGRGVTLRKIHDYIKLKYPSTTSNIIKLRNTLEKALSFGAVNKKLGDRYVLGKVISSLAPAAKRKHGRRMMKRKRRKSRSRRKRRGRKRLYRRYPLMPKYKHY